VQLFLLKYRRRRSMIFCSAVLFYFIVRQPA
jgi:hypothetical protein